MKLKVNNQIEKKINPFRMQWQKRYYQHLFPKQYSIPSICQNYMEGLEWTMKYYTSGCPNWRWRYKYNYPPLLQDLIRFIPLFNTEFVPAVQLAPVSEIVQLCYVLPRPSLQLLPSKLYFELLKQHDDWYKGNCEFVWAYCRYFWEAHVDMNEIDIDELEKFIATNKHLLR